MTWLPATVHTEAVVEAKLTARLEDAVAVRLKGAVPKGWFVSAGYFFSENSIPDKTYNPVVPDDDLHLGSIGFGRKGQRWNWALAYHFALNPTRTVKNNQTISAIGETADGTYKYFNQAVSASATFKF